MLIALFKYGPISVAYEVMPDFLLYYDGVYSN
jgi:hypothetical protein